MSQLFDLTGKVALVTGGNDGIGRAVATTLGELGAAIAVWGTNERRNREAVEHLRAAGIEAHAYQCDVSDDSAVDRTIGATLDDFGCIDFGVVNAGVLQRAIAFADLETSEWHRVLAVDLDGAFFTARGIVKHMQQRGGGGSLVFMSSIAALHGQPAGTSYSVAKAAVIGLTRSLAVELGQDRIRVNAVLPGWITTKMTEPVLQDSYFTERVLKRIPIRRWGEPSDVGGICAYFASDASRWHTGDVVVIDGGYTVF